jgi:hypothetical protein
LRHEYLPAKFTRKARAPPGAAGLLVGAARLLLLVPPGGLIGVMIGCEPERGVVSALKEDMSGVEAGRLLSLGVLAGVEMDTEPLSSTSWVTLEYKSENQYEVKLEK